MGIDEKPYTTGITTFEAAGSGCYHWRREFTNLPEHPGIKRLSPVSLTGLVTRNAGPRTRRWKATVPDVEDYGVQPHEAVGYGPTRLAAVAAALNALPAWFLT